MKTDKNNNFTNELNNKIYSATRLAKYYSLIVLLKTK